MLVRIGITILANIISLNSFSQNLSSIEGKIIDADTKEPLAFASVYLAKTSIGVATNLDGSFILQKIPLGKFDLTISILGYKTLSKSIVFDGTNIPDFVVELKSIPKELEMVTVMSSKIKRSKLALNEFKKFFLGETRNASACHILNESDLFAYKQDGKLIALSSKPIEILNEALGYKIIYELKEFEVNYLKNQVLTSGIPRFEELAPKDERQKKKWLKERDRAYYGSFEHFLRSLLHHESGKNYFVMRDQQGLPVSEENLLQQNILSYKGILHVSYLNEYPEIQNRRYPITEQNSTIEFSGIPITIFENGNFEEFHNLILDGYFGWISHIGELLPYGYEPSKDIKTY